MTSSISASNALPAGDILIVDDTPANLRLLVAMLAEQGYKVRPALNGELALMNARAVPPDLILLDIKMPALNGYQVCEQLKADPRTRDIPVLFISALDDTLDKVRAFEAGGVDYITKPFQAQEVLARVHTHLALHNLHQNLQAKIDELDAFAHTVAHDLKSPLSVLMGYATLLAEVPPAGLDEMHQKCVGAIVKTGHKMDTIIDELLLLSSVRQVDQVSLAPLDMAEIVAEAQARSRDLIAERQAEIVLPDQWPVAVGYAPWIEEVWANYLSNALKYGGRPEEGIPPRVELGFDEPGRETLRFWVRDNGPGLSPEDQGKLFVPFARLHQVRIEGHGLGLSIVRRIVEKLGGQVGVESVAGQGSTFFFTLPPDVESMPGKEQGND